MAVTLPVVNGSSGTWGTILNAALTDIDERLSAAVTANSTQTTDIDALKTRITTLEGGAGGSSGLTVASSGNRPPLEVGQIVLEADTGHLYYAASVNGTATRVPFPGSYLAKIKKTTSQSMGSGSVNTIVFTAADYDRLGGWNSGTPTRYTAQVPGTYEFTGAMAWAANANGARSVWLNYKGSVFNGTGITVSGTAGEPTVVPLRPTVLRLNAGEYVEVVCVQTSGATLASETAVAYQPGLQVKYLGYNAS